LGEETVYQNKSSETADSYQLNTSSVALRPKKSIFRAASKELIASLIIIVLLLVNADVKTISSFAKESTPTSTPRPKIGIENVARIKQLKKFNAQPLSISSMSFSPTGEILAVGKELIAGGGDILGNIELWNIRTGARKIIYKGHPDNSVVDVAFSPDNTLLASGGQDGTMRFWDAQTRKSKLILEGGGVLAFSPDGMLLASGSGDGSVRLWDVKTVKEIRVMKEPEWTTDIVFSPDGTLLATANMDQKVRLWNVKTGEQVSVMEHTDRVLSVAFSPDGTLLASGGGDQMLRVWDVKTGKQLNTLEHPNWVLSVVFSSDGSLLISGCTDGAIRLWDAKTGKQVKIFEADEQIPVSALVFSPDGSLLASGDFQAVIRLWGI
jgi:WD40 repeat protein